MSFFNTLQQYVSNSVANLNISPRRFAGQRQDSTSSNTEEQLPSSSGGGSFKAHSTSTSSSDAESASGGAHYPPPRSPLMRQNVTQSPGLASQRHHHLTMQERSTSLRSAPLGAGQLQHHNSAPAIKRSGGAANRAGSLKELPSSSSGGNNSSGLFVSPSGGGNGTGSHPPLSPSQHNNRRRAPKLLPTFAIHRNLASSSSAAATGLPSNSTSSATSIRRTSWPQFAITGSGVQESDGSFFESYTALCWKQENRRLQVLRSEDQQDHHMQQTSPSPPLTDHSPKPTIKEMEQLYVEVLYTIRHKLGAHSAQYPHHYKEDLALYAQQAFGVGQDFHYRCHAIASEEKPPIVVLNVMVIEAEGLEAKDPNGFSDPYCMLGIQPGTKMDQSPTPQQAANDDESADSVGGGAPSGGGGGGGGGRRDSLINLAQLERLKKHSSFRISFKRKESADYRSSSSASSTLAAGSGGSSVSSSAGSSANCLPGHQHHQREQRDSLHAALPAKFIRATSVKNATLNPKWNEKFRFDIDDVSSDLVHLDIWDHDDEYSVLDAVSKLNEVRGVKGLGRFFKQIAQSARSNGNQDDFLGCVNIPLQEIPSTGLETWYKLGGRSQRSTIQGRIHLKLWLSTREDFGTSEEDNWTELKQQEKLYCTFIDYEVSRFKNSSTGQWSGELSQTALNILHQHAIQGDVTALQSQVIRWISYSRKVQEKDLHFSVLYRVLNDLDRTWITSSETLSRDEEDALAQSFTSFVDYALSCIRRLRTLYGPAKQSSTTKLDYLLRCLTHLDTTRAFRRCCPFHKEIRGEIVAAIRKGAAEWITNELHRCVPGDTGANLSAHINGLTTLTNRVYADLTRSHQLYDEIFQKICCISYFVLVYKSHMKAMLHEYGCRLDTLRHCFTVVNSNGGCNGPDPSSSTSAEMNVLLPVFELNIALQDLQKFQDHIPAEELASAIGGGVGQQLQNQPLQQSVMALTCHECFRSVLESWLITARSKSLNRVRSAVELDAFTNVEPYLKHSTSAIDATSCFYQICDFWKQLSWPELISSYPFVYSIVEMITASAIVYADLIFLRVQSNGFFGDDWRMTAAVTDQVYVNMNNLQHVKNAISTLPQTLKLANIICAVDGLTPTTASGSSNNGSTIDAQRSPSSGRSRSASIVSGSCTGSNQLSHLTAGSASATGASNCYENSARQAFSALLDIVREHYENKLLRIAGCLADKMRNELKKNIFHLAWSPDSLPATEAAAPLIDCLDNILLDLEPHLLPAAFERCVAALWDVLLVELWSQAQASSGGDKFCKFYDRLYVALQMLVQFLHADGKGLTMEGLKGATYQRVEEKIALHKTRTDLLIDQYHAGRLEQQRQVLMAQHAAGCTDAESAPYGVLSVRVYFHHDSLSVEIISARDVIPLDPNGLSDPFVIIELLPRRLFSHCTEQKTSVRHKNLNPVFDECFEFPVTLDQCRQETAMLLFTVMDYDVLTANDFAGEAFLSLNSVPGVAAAPQGLHDTFHGLKQIDLVLMHQTNKHPAILSVLESRVWDRTAQDFVRKQKDRIVN